VTLLEEVITVLHDQVCRCGGRCIGWRMDELGMREFLDKQYGSRGALDVERGNA